MKKITLLFTTIFWIVFKLNAGILVVPTDYNNIQQAIDNASNGDIIEVLPGTYSGEGNIKIDFKGKNISLKSTKGADSTIIDCQTTGRAFYFHSKENSNTLINGFTIRNGDSGSDYGGAINCSWSSPQIINCIFEDCDGGKGGGMYISNSSPIIKDCIFRNIHPEYGGKVIECYYSSPLIENCLFTNNTTCSATLNITFFSNPIIKNCVFKGNSCPQYAGAGTVIDIYYNSNPEIINSQIIDNSAKGVSITNYSYVKIINCLVANNASDGLHTSNFDRTVTIKNTSIVNNGGYGIYSGATNFNITNSIIYGNTKEEIYLWSGNPPNISYSVVEGKDGDEIYGKINWIGANYDQNPDFLDLINHNYELKRNSICIENGDPSKQIAYTEKDLSGKPRIMGKHIDIGPYEYCLSIAENNYSICSGDSILLGNSWKKTTGSYSDTIIGANGCDSITTIKLTVNKSTQASITKTVCDSYTSPSGKYTWATSGTYQDIIPNSNGCDSIITINLTVNKGTQATISKSVCDSYTSPSGNYTWTTSGTYQDIIPNSNGCDSIITINLTVNKSTQASISKIVCDSYTSPSGNYTWTTSGTYQDIIPNSNGCDSIITISLIVNEGSKATIYKTVCDSYTPPSGNYTWTTSGTYQDIIQNSNLCDYIITINLTVNKSTQATISKTVCDSYTSPSGNYTWTTSGTYQDIIPNSNGCDSLLTIDLTVTGINPVVELTEDGLTSMEDNALYQWEICTTGNIINGATAKSYKPIVPGLYAVKISKSGCEITSSCYSYILSDTEMINTNNSPLIYPNPVYNDITIDLQKYYNNVEVEIFDINGKEISTLQYQNLNMIRLKTDYLQNGIYILKLNTEDNILRYKILKK
jgi:hypothetical protein